MSCPVGEGDAGEAAGEHPHVVAVVDGEGPQVDVARLEAVFLSVGTVDSCTTGCAIHPRGSSRICARTCVELLLATPWGRSSTPLPPAPSTGLTTSSASRSSTSSRASGSSSRHVSTLGRIGLFAQVIAGEGGHVGVDELVVGYAVAHRVGDGDVAQSGGVDEAWRA